jgi:hypothetical protein
MSFIAAEYFTKPAECLIKPMAGWTNDFGWVIAVSRDYNTLSGPLCRIRY